MPEEPEQGTHWMMRCLARFERITTIALLVVMMLAILLATIDLGWSLLVQIWEPPRLVLDIQEITVIFGFVFTILIGLELLETIKTYLSEEQLHVEVVFLVAMIAVARKVIILEIKEPGALELFAIAAIILALAAGFFLFKLASRLGVRRPKAGKGGEPPSAAEPEQKAD